MRSKGSHSIDAKICQAKKARAACLLNESIKIGMHKCAREPFGWKSDAQLKSTYCMDAIVTLFLAASVCTIAPVLLYYPHRLLWIQAKDCWSLQWYHAQQCESSKCHFCCWDQRESRGCCNNMQSEWKQCWLIVEWKHLDGGDYSVWIIARSWTIWWKRDPRHWRC